MFGAAAGVRQETHFRFALGRGGRGPLGATRSKPSGRLVTAGIGIVFAGWATSRRSRPGSSKAPGAPLPVGVNFAPFVVGAADRAVRARAVCAKWRGEERDGADDLVRHVRGAARRRRVRRRIAAGSRRSLTLLYLGLPADVLVIETAAGTDSSTLLAIPLFIFTGGTDAARRDFRAAHRFRELARRPSPRRPGAGDVSSCLLFGGVSGSAIADVSAMAGPMIPQMVERGYRADYAVNVTISAALVALLVPPSHNLILFSAAAGGGDFDRRPFRCRNLSRAAAGRHRSC